MSDDHLPALDPPALLRRHGLRPKQSLGQNFLVSEAALRQVVEAGSIDPLDTILEIGPGLGSLTRLLALRAARVIAVEIDPRLIPPLREVLAGFDNVEIVEADILSQDLERLVGGQPYRVVANIPYYITSRLIRYLLTSSRPPESLTLTVQREVAERICARPGKMSLLALSVQVFGRPTIRARLKAGAFYPPPKVGSAVVQVERFDAPLVPENQLDLFFRIARAGFQQRRKTLRNALSAGLAVSKENAGAWLLAAGVDPNRRAETLSMPEWRELVQAYADMQVGGQSGA